MSERITGLVDNLHGKKKEAGLVLLDYLKLGSKFENPPRVEIRLMPNARSRDIAITTAVQCYAPGDAKLKERTDEKSQSIADSTLVAGHHTTRMHANYTFWIDVTRDLTERTLHSHPFYNSEQQSQRYVEAKAGNYEVPAGLTEEQREIYIQTAEYSNQAYFDLLGLLNPEVERRIKEMYPEKGWNVQKTADRLNTKVKKICQEVARYVLPIAQRTKMYHTLNELQILRLFRASQQENFTDEGRYVIAKMIEEIAQHDDSILLELEKPLPEYPSPRFENKVISEQQTEIDILLKDKDGILLGNTENPRKVLVQAVRNVLGISQTAMGDEDVLNLLMSPKNNPLLADTYETGMLHPLTACLRQISFTFISKVSHTAESQRQRHRRTPGAVPPIEKTYTGQPDYVTPLVIRENRVLREKYDQVMQNIYRGVERCIQAGIPLQTALKLLPNAHALRIVETGDLFDWLHRFKQRLCYLAQEEICFLSICEAEQILEVLPEAESMLQAPCGVAVVAGTGKCPEGDRWCGQPVWKLKIQDYKKGRLV